MYDLPKRVVFLFIACSSVSANRWWRDTGYDHLDDSPEVTPPPKAPYLNTGTPPLNTTLGGGIFHLLAARQLAGCRVCNELTPTCCNNGTYCCARNMFCQDAGNWCCPDGQEACPGAPNVCRKNGQTCCGGIVCENSNSTCSDGRCLSLSDQTTTTSNSSTSTSTTSQTQPTPGEGSPTPDPPTTSSSSETSSTSVVVDPPVDSTSSSTGTTVSVDPPQTSSVPLSDPTQVVSIEETASLDTPPSSFVDLPSDPIVDPLSATLDALDTANPEPSDPIAPAPDPNPSDPIAPAADPNPSDPIAPSANPDPSDPVAPPVDSPAPNADAPTSSVVLETSTSNGVTLTLSHTVAPHILTAPTNTATNIAQEDDSDVVALVLPWDPRIQYDPESAWVSTTSSSSVGSCHNGTKVASQAGASIKFAFEGKEISALTCSGSKAGDYSVQVDGAPATNLNGYKAPGVQGDECIVSQTFNSGMLVDGNHNISIIVKGSNSAQLSGGTAVEFGGFIYRGPHAYGTAIETKNNTPAIIGGTVGGVIGGILILTIIIVIIIRRRRNRRVDDAPAVHTIPVTSGTPYSAVPTAEYHDPYANSGYGPNYYPNPTATPSTQPAPAWRSTAQGPFGEGSYVAGY